MAQTLAQRVSRHDREIAAIRKLVLTGMKMLVRIERGLDRLEGQQEAMRQDMRQLAAAQRETSTAQRETERKLQGLIDALQRGGNGRGPSSH